MSFLTFDEKQAEGFSLPPAGKYEVYVKNAKAVTSGVKGTPGIELLLVIRQDIEQAGKGQNIYDTLWISEKAMFRFHQINKAVGVEQGTVFETKEDQIKFLLAKPLVVEVEAEEYTNSKNEDRKRLVVKKFEPTEQGLGFTAPVEGDSASDDPFANNGPINITDEDLPF